MSIRNLMLLTVVFVLAVTLGARAQYDERQFVEGTKEFIVSGSGSSDNDFDSTVASVNLSWGYFFADNWEAAVRQELSIFDTTEDSNLNGSTRIAVDYHRPMGMYQPFIGANIGYIYGDGVEESFIAGPEVGLKVLIKDETFLYGSVEYQFLFDDASDADEGFEDGRFVYSIGMGVTF